MIKYTAIVTILLLTVIHAGAMEPQGPKIFRTPRTALSRRTKQNIALTALTTTAMIAKTDGYETLTPEQEHNANKAFGTCVIAGMAICAFCTPMVINCCIECCEDCCCRRNP